MRFSPLLPLCGILLLLPTLASSETLKEAAGKRLLVGCALATVDIDDPRTAALAAEQFDCVTPEYELMPEFLADAQGAFTFQRGDRVVAFAEAHHMAVLGHMLIWHFVTRKWLFEDCRRKAASQGKSARQS